MKNMEIKKRRKGFMALLAAGLLFFNLLPMNAFAAEEYDFTRGATWNDHMYNTEGHTGITLNSGDKIIKLDSGDHLFINIAPNDNEDNYNGDSRRVVETGSTTYYFLVQDGEKFSATKTSSGANLVLTSIYTVTFDSAGGTAVASQEVLHGGKAAEPTAPTKEGYTFAGWYKEAACSNVWNFTTEVLSANTTLYAKWTANTYTVAFDANGGTGTMNNQVRAYGDGAALTANAFTRTGYTFSGWNTKADGTGTAVADKATTDLTADNQATVTLYAQWTVNNFTVTFDSDGGSEVAAQSVAYGGKVTKPDAPTKEGYVFDKWIVKASDATSANNGTTETEWDFENDTISADTTLNAKWKIVAFTVTFDSDGGSEVAAQSVNRGEKVTKPDSPTKKGYTFDKWVIKDAENVSAWDFDKDTVTSDITLYATWNGDWNDSDSKQGLKEGYTDISDGIKKAGYDTETKIKDALYKAIVTETGESSADEGTVIVDSKLYDVTFQVSFDGGNTYVAVTKDNFPEEGLVVTIPYPEGTSKDGNDFIVAHMFSEDMNGHAAGDIEKPAVTKADEGIQFRVSGLSPVLVSWTTVKKTETQPKSEPSSEPETQPTQEPEPAPQARAPKTGDSPVALYVVIMLALAGVSLTAYSAFGRKRR